MWDCVRKCLDTIAHLQREVTVSGFRKIKHIRKTLKSTFRATSFKVFKGRNEEQKKQSVRLYLQQAQSLVERCKEVLKNEASYATNTVALMHLLDLNQYKCYAEKMIDLVRRRLLNGETIPASEKIHSIFEPHTEWITKGKLNKNVELGHLLLITTDQYSFIIDYKVMEGEKDAAQIPSLLSRISERFSDQTICSHSVDKGFYSKSNYEAMTQAGIQEVIMPKKGKCNKVEKERESTSTFKTLRNAHSAIESNINMLEHHGLNRCLDKGLQGYKRYVGLSVLAYNLHILGNCLIAAEKKQQEKLRKKSANQHRHAA